MKSDQVTNNIQNLISCCFKNRRFTVNYNLHKFITLYIYNIKIEIIETYFVMFSRNFKFLKMTILVQFNFRVHKIYT
jgi:hypothetical protein